MHHLYTSVAFYIYVDDAINASLLSLHFFPFFLTRLSTRNRISYIILSLFAGVLLDDDISVAISTALTSKYAPIENDLRQFQRFVEKTNGITSQVFPYDLHDSRLVFLQETKENLHEIIL